MNRKMRAIAWLLAVIMLAGSLPSSALAAEAVTNEPGVNQAEAGEPDLDDAAAWEPGPVTENPAVEDEPQAGSDIAKEPSSESMPERNEKSGPKDLTKLNGAADIKAWAAQYQAADGNVETVPAREGRLDLSQVPAAMLNEITLSFYFRLHSEKAAGGIRAGDTFHISMQGDCFTVEDTQQPVPVYLCEETDHSRDTDVNIGSYEIVDQVIMVTVNEGIEAVTEGSLAGTLKMNVKVAVTSLSGTETTEVRIKDQESVIILPAVPPADSGAPGSDAAKDETADKGNAELKDEVANGTTGAVEDSDADTEEKKPSNLLGGFRSLLKGVGTSSGNADGRTGTKAEKALKTEHTFTKEELTKAGFSGFDEIRLTVYSKEGGYTKNDENPLVNFAYKVFMDEGVLYERSEEMTMDSTFPINKGDTEAWLFKAQEWLENHPEFETIEYTYDMGEYFGTFTSEKYSITMDPYENIDIGSYKVAEGKLTISMNPLCCLMDNVFFEFNINAAVNKDKLNDKPQEVVVNEKGELVFQSTGTAQGGGQTPEDSKYTVTKDAPSRVTDTSIKYEISVEALEGQRLNGLTLRDAVPAGLTVARADVFTSGPNNNDGTYVDFKDKEYTFAPYDAANPESEITRADFTFVMELNEDKYEEFIKNGINETFTNRASLYGEGPLEPLAVSEEVSTRMSARFLQKTGRSKNLEGTKYDWTIELSTQLPSMEYGYLVDTLCWTDHQYDFGSGIQIQVDGTNYTITNFEDISGSFDSPWKGITAAAMNSAGISGEFNKENPTAYYYVTDETDEEGNPIQNPFYGVNDDEPEYEQRAVLIIPYKNLQGTAEKSKSVTIKYTTDLNMHGFDSEPQQYWEIMQDKGYTPVIDNEANLLWYNTGGIGPGPAPQDSVNFGKEVESNPSAVTKKGIRYDEKTQMLTWSVDVNKLGIPMENVVLEDVLPAAVYKIPDNMTVSWYKYSRAEQTLKESGTYKPDDGNCRVIDKPDGTKALQIELGDVLADDMYTLNFAVQLVDESLLSQQSQSLSVSNKVKISYSLEGTPKDYEVEGTQGVRNTLIEKSAAGNYDYNTYELPWKVTINPNNLTVGDAKFTDTLEAGFSFGRITRVVYGGADDEGRLEDLREQLEKPDFVKDAPVFNLGTIDKTFTIYFTTTASAGWRDDNLKTENDTGAIKNVQVTNTAILNGTIGGKNITGAKDDAQNTVLANPIGKTGIYNEEKGTIDWSLELNQEHYNLSNLILSETLTEEGNTPIHELDVDSLEIMRLIQDSDGTYREEDAKDSVTIKMNQDGFTCGFRAGTDGGNYDTYRIRFTTLLTGDAYGQKIQNKVYLKDDGGNTANSSGTSDGGYDGNFELDKNSNAQVRPSVRLRKISANSAGEEKDDSLGLSKAKFILEVHGFSYDSETNKLSIGEDVVQYEKARYTKDGEIYFTNIKTSTRADGKNDLICVMKEQAPPDGYVINKEPRFVYFSTEEGNEISDSMKIISYEGAEYTELGTYYQRQIITDGTAPWASAVFEDKPVESEFTFTKKDIEWAEYKDENGKAERQYKSAQGVEFTVTPLDALSGEVDPQTVTTKANGEATIKNLDAGTYLLTETGANKGMKPGTVRLEVAWNADNDGYDYAFVNGTETGGLKINPEKGTELLNDVNTTAASFKKYADYTDGTKEQIIAENQETLSGAAFRLASVAPDADSPGAAAGNIIQTVKSDSKGKVEFTNLPLGNYEIYEVYENTDGKQNVPGYVTNGKEELVYTLSITEKDTQTDNAGGKKLICVLTPERTATGISGAEADTAEICYNRPVKGTISFDKTSAGDGLSAFEGAALAGAEFGLFRKIGSEISKEAVYSAVSDSTGRVTFGGASDIVEFGGYVLKETKTPDGYVPMEPVEISRNDLEISSDGTGFTYRISDTGENALTVKAANHLYKAKLLLMKHDADNQPMAGIGFTVFRRGIGGIGADGKVEGTALQQMPLEVYPDVKTYYPYKPSITSAENRPEQGKVMTGTEGKINIDNLPYGDYLLVEDTAGLDLQEGSRKVAVYIRVGRDNDGNYTTAVQVNENADIRYDEGKKAYTLEEISASSGWKECNVKDGSYIVMNHKKYGYVNLEKIAAGKNGEAQDSVEALSGATFQIYNKNSSGNWKLYLTLKTNKQGQFSTTADGGYQDSAAGGTRHLWYGDYMIKEIKSPAGYCLNSKEIEFTIGEGKDSGGNTLAGHLGTAWISMGKDSLTDVTYQTGDDESAGLTVAPDEKYFINEPVMLTLYKTDGQTGTPKPLGGTTFLLSPKNPSDKFADGSSEKAVTTDDSGKAEISGLLAAGTTYVLTEAKAPDGYVTPADADTQFKVSDDGKTILLDASHNGLQAELENGNGLHIQNRKTTLSIQKQDGDGKGLAGAGLALYRWDEDKGSKVGEAVKTWFSTKDSLMLQGEIAEGTYVLEETSRPDGYLKADSIYFSLKAGNKVTLIAGPDGDTNGIVTDSTITMTDKKILQDISLMKTYNGKEGEGIARIAFDLYDASRPEEPAAAGYTDDNGRLVFQDIAEGSYLLKENLDKSTAQGAADDVYIDEEWSLKVEVTVDAAEKQVVLKVDGREQTENQDIQVTNDVFAAGLTMKKLDAEDNTALKGVTFLLEKKNSSTYEPYAQDNNNGLYRTDDTGLHIENLVKGDYRLTEADTIYGYELDKDKAFCAEFTVTNSAQGKSLAINKTAAQEKQWQLKVVSGGELLTDRGLANIRSTGSVTLKKVDPAENTGLNGVVFKLYMKKDGSWLENTWNFITGKQYESIGDIEGKDLDEQGALTIGGLKWGDYKLVETAAKAGYILDDTPYEFTIGHADTDIVLDVDKGSIKNVPNEITLEKRGSGLTPGEGDEDLLDGAVFTITNEQDESDTFTVPVDGGRVTLSARLTGGGTYRLHELQAPVGYALNPSSKDVVFTMAADGSIEVDGKKVPGNVLSIENDPTLLTFKKVGRYNEDCAKGQGADSADAVRPLEGAEFTAYPADTPDIPAGTAVSGADGLVTFEKLPLGRYYFKETAVPEGHRPNENTYIGEVVSGEFKGLLDAGGNPLPENTIVNDVYRTDIRFTKVNEKNTEEVLEGSEYGLYKHSAAAAKIKASGQQVLPAEGQAGWELIATAVTDANGMLEFKGVLMDTEYMVRELKAPDGSYVSANPMKVTFAVNETGAIDMTLDDGSGTVSVDPETGEIIWLEPPVEISFSKQDLDGQPLAGAMLQIQDNNGGVMEEWISDAKPHIVSGALTAGENYQLVEIKAPDGYSLAQPVDFTVPDEAVGVDENKVIPVVMEDAPIRLKIVKADKTTGNTIPGSIFRITGSLAGGTTDCDVKPGTGQDTLTSMLAAGNAYHITEVSAPEGYVKLAAPISINVDEKGSIELSENSGNSAAALKEEDGIYVLTITNEKELTAGFISSNTRSGSAAKTGDKTPVLPWGAVCTVSLGMAAAIWRRRKKSGLGR